MPREKLHVGLEIGTTKVCAVVAESRPNGELRLLGVGESPSRGVRKGEIVDFTNASKCVHDALADAEDRSDREIDKVWLGITGGHIKGFNHRNSATLPTETEITESEIDEVECKEQDLGIPKDNVLLHSLIQRYFVDGQAGVIDPRGMLGTRLEADFHIIHGIANRIQNAVRCVKEYEIDVVDIVVNSLASAQVVLNDHQKRAGALIVDIGGGTTDFLVYQDGAIRHSGVIGIGGDHVTNDLCIGLRIPIARAEKLKIEEGAASLDAIKPGDRIILKNDTGFSGREVDRRTLNVIIHARLHELFTILRKRVQETVPEHMLGAGILLTGGCSLTKGIREVAESVFQGTPVNLAHAQSVSGPASAFENPQLSTCIGLTRYAQLAHAQMPNTSLFDSFLKQLGNKLKIV
jgi:cell division protein FtsA